jgi:hypothetical protein
MMKTFELLWWDKKKGTVRGETIADAFQKAGLGAGALAALDYYQEISQEDSPSELVAVRAFIAVVEERIAGYRVMKDLNICSEEFIATWSKIKEYMRDGRMMEGDSQAGDLFAKVYKQMALPCDLYQEIFLKHFKPVIQVKERACGNPECKVSTGIAEELTFGSGKLSDNGYWEVPCLVCARAAEKKDGVAVNSYWPPERMDSGVCSYCQSLVGVDSDGLIGFHLVGGGDVGMPACKGVGSEPECLVGKKK